MCQSAEMLGELDEPPPRLIKKRDLLSAAWTSIAAFGSVAEKGEMTPQAPRPYFAYPRNSP